MLKPAPLLTSYAMTPPSPPSFPCLTRLPSYGTSCLDTFINMILLVPATLLQMIIAKDGVLGLMGRGLKTKIIANGMQVRPARLNRRLHGFSTHVVWCYGVNRLVSCTGLHVLVSTARRWPHCTLKSKAFNDCGGWALVDLAMQLLHVAHQAARPRPS